MRISDWSSDVCSSDLTATGPFFRAADVVAFPSRHEPFGTVSLEAWAYGKPLVTTDVDGPAELVRPDEDALVVTKDDVAALAKALRRAIEDSDLPATLVAAGRERHRTGFTRHIRRRTQIVSTQCRG